MLVLFSVLGGLGWLWWSSVWRSDINFLPRLAPAHWIIYPAGSQGTAQPRLEMSTLFRRSFALERAPSQAVLSVAGFRQYTLSINGKAVAAPAQPKSTWKQPDRFEVSRELRAGENQIAVAVLNSNGPPVMWLSLDTGGLQLNSDETWQASYAGAVWRPARLAGKPRVVLAGGPGYGEEEPWASLRARWPTLLIFAMLSAAGYWLVNRWVGKASVLTSLDSKRLPKMFGFARALALPFVLAGLWMALFANNLGVLPSLAGYDVNGHMDYLRYIQEHHSLPLAGEGWEMFQPPLYYLLGAALLSLLSLSVTQDGGIMALRLMGMFIGVAHFALVWASLRLLFPGERFKLRSGLVLAAALPPLLYLSQYVSNEGLAAALVSACVCLTLHILKQERASWKLSAGLGLCLGAALLTKSTALLVVAVVFGAVLWKWLAQGADSPGRWAGRMCLTLGVCALVSGWHYARLWAHYGSPVLGVWDPRLGFSWWQDDGYRTGAFYLRFGEVLRHPWFSSYQSFGDGIYGTLWGDGLFGGAADALARPPWNYELMAVGYWLALAPAIAVGVGSIVALVKFLRRPSPEWLLLLGLGFLTALAVIYMSIAVPYQCMVKAFYGLCALVPLCAFGACGLDALCRWSGKLRPAVCILFGLWAINSYAAFWISRSSVAASLSRARSLWKEGRQRESVGLLKAGLALHPEGAEMRSFLAFLCLSKETSDPKEALQQAETALRASPNDPKVHLVLSAVLAQQRRGKPAVEHAKRAVDLAPGDSQGYEQLAGLLDRLKRYDQVIQAAREGLAVAPFSAELRFVLGTALAFRGENAEAISQLQLACGIWPNWGDPRVLLGATLAKQGNLEEAIQNLREALRLEPDNAGAHSQLAAALNAQQQTADAVAHYNEALRLEPDFAEALNNLAWIRAAHPRAEFRDGPEAVRLAERACQVTGSKEAVLVGTLAAAYAEAGRFDEAVATARKAQELALAGGQKGLAEKDEKLVDLFSARQPYREPTEPKLPGREGERPREP
jgi:tetratricopeptide (TPR) repeat protein